MASLVWVLSLISTLALSAAAVSSSSWLPTSSVDCDSVVMDMMDCLPYVTKGSNQSHPDKDCCEGVSSVVKLSPVCLCAALEEAIRMGIDVDMKRAAGLPKACSIKVSVGNCGAPPPNVPGPAPSPKPTPPPPKTPTPSPAPPTPPKSPPTPPPPSKPTPPPPPAPKSPPPHSPVAPPKSSPPPTIPVGPPSLPPAPAPAPVQPEPDSSTARRLPISIMAAMIALVVAACSYLEP